MRAVTTRAFGLLPALHDEQYNADIHVTSEGYQENHTMAYGDSAIARRSMLESPPLLIVVEFTGLARTATFSVALPSRPADRTLVVDPMSLGYGEYLTIAERARVVAAEVANRAVPDAIIVAACSGVPFLGPLSSCLADAGIPVPLSVAVDPVWVDDAVLEQCLREIAGRLRAVESPGDLNAILAVPHSELSQRMKVINSVLSSWIEIYLAARPESPEFNDLVWHDVARRHLAWLAYLSAAVGVQEPVLAREQHLFTLQEKFNSAELSATEEASVHAYDQIQASELLVHPRLAFDLQQLLLRFGWQGI